MRVVRIGALRWGAIVACAWGALAFAAPALARTGPATLSVGRTPVGRAIPPDFLGMAFEYGSIPAWVGPDPAQPNPVLIQLIRNLNPTGRPLIRIGGLSTDRSWWPVPGLGQPRGVTYALGPGWSQSVTGLARAVNARLMLGVNLEADDPPLAQTEARQFLATIGRRYVSSLDLGNEPPLYDSVPWYRVKNGKLVPWYRDAGRAVFSRGLSWGPRAFATDYARTLAALPNIPIAGPDTQQPAWFAAYRRFISRHSRVRMLVSHGYGLNSCVTAPSSAAYPSIPHLLSDYALHDLLGQLTGYIALAHRDAMPFRIDEMGSVTCNGRWGVSNTMASALWATAALFSVARDGVDGVNLHSYPDLPNALFDFSRTSGRWTAAVHPMYYGALLFARAAPAGSRLLSMRLRGPSSLHAWATAGPGAARHIVVVNESRTTAASVVVSGFGGGPAGLQRLSASGPSGASSASATRGITLGGRTFGAVTITGRLAPPVRARVAARGGVYRVMVPAASALLLTRYAPVPP
jgi:hypothetical protein